MVVQEPSQNTRISRRLFLRVLTGAGSASMLGPWLVGDLRALAGRAPRGTGSASWRQEGLTDHEIGELVALAVVLYPPADDRERRELEATSRWWVLGRSSRGDRLPLYREGLAELGGAVRAVGRAGSFGELDPVARADLVGRLHGLGSDGPFERLVAELAEGVYATAIGWRVVGYPTAPGTPSGVLQYTPVARPLHWLDDPATGPRLYP